MSISAFWAKGYRSLVDVHIEPLGAFNVFHGPNGVGKSNILAAIQLLFEVVAWRSRPEVMFSDISQPTATRNLLDPYDACNFDSLQRTTLGARLYPPTREQDASEPRIHELTIEVEIDWPRQAIAITRLQHGDVDLVPLVRRGAAPEEQDRAALALSFYAPDNAYVTDEDERRRILQSLVHFVATASYALIGADRMLRREVLSPDKANVALLFAQGRLKEGLFRASNHPDVRLRRRFRQLQQLLMGEPLRRRPFELTHDSETGIVELVESSSDSMDNPAEVPLDLAGLGIVQIYNILGQALFRGAQAIGIEEPEAHLHAPTTGGQLRQLLEHLVNEGYVDQLFLATHSTQFALDAEGYFDVSLNEQGATLVSRQPLTALDKR